MNKINFSRLCCLIVLISSIQPQATGAQGMGMGRMGGMGGGGGHGASQSNAPPAEPEVPVTKFNPFAVDAAPVEGLDARTSALERFVFGHSQSGQKMKVRVQRLEKKLVPYEHHSGSDPDLGKRVDHLWKTLEGGNKNTAKGMSIDDPVEGESKGKKKSE